MKMRNSKKLLWIAFVAIAAVSAFPWGAAAACGERCNPVSPTCSQCGPGTNQREACIAASPCVCMTITCPTTTAEKAPADSALALLLTPPDAQTANQCTLQEPVVLGD